jgi:hypothetical protein
MSARMIFGCVFRLRMESLDPPVPVRRGARRGSKTKAINGRIIAWSDGLWPTLGNRYRVAELPSRVAELPSFFAGA